MRGERFQPLDRGPSGAGWDGMLTGRSACKRSGRFGKAIDLMTKEKVADALELASPYINLGNCYKRMLNLGVVCAEQGRNEEAEKYYLDTLELRIHIQQFGRLPAQDA
jgi:hypothetical protein